MRQSDSGMASLSPNILGNLSEFVLTVHKCLLCAFNNILYANTNSDVLVFNFLVWFCLVSHSFRSSSSIFGRVLFSFP